MNIAIKVISRVNDKRYLKSMDFEVIINGESDNTEYRMTDGEKGFKKTFQYWKSARVFREGQHKKRSTEPCKCDI